ncbi:hypothetical protein Esi_0163_0015 [Ectocarpus siliculosus]|uniref:Uncharacterized protein n=1 Tax=Ectocarpus siliculosus TaxID=2880 RepID=D7FM17_ECTSI|nr:hypothetical protein Esi_0163_0015 [Ectocarpus siliculosus]|eukprot:CBJ29842.1 hypothetical protein Esi_0163_0015 [Ectocarpus siliculosus]
MEGHSGTTPYNSYAGASAAIVITGAIVLDGALKWAQRRWRLSSSTDGDRAARHVYEDWAKAGPPFGASNSGYGRATTDATSPGARGIDGSMVRPGRATAALLSVRWLDIELEEEEEARRRELDAMLSAGGGGGGTGGPRSGCGG